jgi:hypothetical protein
VHQLGGEPNRAEQEKHAREKAYIQRNLERRGVEAGNSEATLADFGANLGYSIPCERIEGTRYGAWRAGELKKEDESRLVSTGRTNKCAIQGQ